MLHLRFVWQKQLRIQYIIFSDYMEKTIAQQTVAEKLDALLSLQQIDTKLDEIKKVRGALPEEVSDLEDEITGYQTRLEKFNHEMEELENDIQRNKTGIKDSEGLIAKYGDQQMNVRNNREYDALTKEIELQQLEIQISEKRIKEAHAKIDAKKEEIETTKTLIDQRSQDLESKREELEKIIAESQDEEDELMKKRDNAQKSIEAKLLRYYERLRASLSNGLAVVSVRRGAAEGCNIVIPPQRIVEIKEKKRIIFDEYSGRILADVEDDPEPEEDTKSKRGRRK